MAKWLDEAIFYEIYPQTYCDSNGDGIGDLQGIIGKLDYIESLGVNAIWLNPLYVSPFMDAGYDVEDYFKVAPRYGTNADLQELFEKAHKRGIKIILDLVPGHTSDRCEMFLESRKPEENEYSNRYIWTNGAFDAPEKCKLVCGMCDRDANYLVNFFSSQPALNYGYNIIEYPWQMPYDCEEAKKTREWLKSVICYWLDLGADGFRVDMADSLVKNDDEKTATRLIYKDIRVMMDEKYPEAVLISEWSNPAKSLEAGFDADFYLDHIGNGYHSLFRENETGEDLSFFSENGKGDIKKFLNDYIPKFESSKEYGHIAFITCNHDSPRMSKNFDVETLKLANAFILTQAGIPFVYYGDEIGMKFIDGLTSKEGGFQRTGTRTPMQWDSSKNHGFSASDTPYLPTDESHGAPTVEDQLKDEKSILNITKSIIKLRRENKDLQAKTPMEVIFAETGTNVFAYSRGKFNIVINTSKEEVEINVAIEGEKVYSIGDSAVSSEGKTVVPPKSYTIFKN